MAEQRLRDLKSNTELLILVELLESPSSRLRDIAAHLNITVQAVSQYVGEMKKTGLLTERDGILKPTQKGMQITQEHFTGLKDQIDSILRRIRTIETCVAIAGNRIKKGSAVGLVMKNGMLRAYSGRKASSTGKALESAEEGDDVLVGQLGGIVDLELGKLLLIEAPSEFDGGSKSVNRNRVKKKTEGRSPGLLVAGDVVGAALLLKTIGPDFIIHAPVESSMSALGKGIDVTFCGTADSTNKLLQAIIELKKAWGYEVKWQTFRA